MADEADLAGESAELHLKQALASINSGPKLAPKGICHNPRCEAELDPVPHPVTKEMGNFALFCDGDCAREFEKLRNRR